MGRSGGCPTLSIKSKIKSMKKETNSYLKKDKLKRIKQEKEAIENNSLYLNFLNNVFLCPICKKFNRTSNYLSNVFEDKKTEWLANMVTHYRHEHITSWNKMWGNYGRSYQKAAHFGNYEEEKSLVNERAKRQIIRKATDFLMTNNITVEHFKALQGTAIKTIELAEKKLKYSKHESRTK